MTSLRSRLLHGVLAGATVLGLVNTAATAASAAPEPPIPTSPSGAYNPEATSAQRLGGVQTRWRDRSPAEDSCATVKQRAIAASKQRHASQGLVSCTRFNAPRTRATVGLGFDPGNDPMPNNCNEIGSKIVGRFADCQVGLIELELWTIPTKPGEVPKLVGVGFIGVGSMTRTGWIAPGISRIVKLQLQEGSWGRALTGIKVSADIKCLGNASKCALDDVSKTYVQELTLGKGLYGYANFHSAPTASDDPNTALWHYMRTTVTVTHSATDLSTKGDSFYHDSESIRCDKRLPGSDPSKSDQGGCVFADLTPFYSLSKTTGTAQAVAQHIERAQTSTTNHWGRYTGSPAVDKPLTRLMDTTLINKNRYEACKTAPSPRPAGKECDEYPFAATHQGAALQGKGDFSWELVKDTDNSAEGGYRSWWFDNFRIIEADPFWVDIVP
ncbi:hypothetical protein AB0H37_40665 [Actinomadura sp. NPDC023710]|uniref:NucA/NucB deoxyribonuclease domain-containing protein n=1 Tax=Actinomadura sp. NPDC023710 TaxID=3158219 RepID=UPI0033E696E5